MADIVHCVPKKVVHQTHGDNFLSILNGFSKFFHCWKAR